MANFVQLTLRSGQPTWVNLDMVVQITAGKVGSAKGPETELWIATTMGQRNETLVINVQEQAETVAQLANGTITR
jgi:hypothetical protein